MQIDLDMCVKGMPTKSSDVVGGYTPTSEDLKNLAVPEGYLKVSGDWIFHTIQGEGVRIGQPTTFIRLHFCNLQCSWCDTWYTWRGDTEQYYKEPKNLKLDEIHQEVEKAQKFQGAKTHVYDITFTGGEPMIQRKGIEEFMRAHPEYKIQIETNGTIMPSDYLMEHVRWNCSPKIGCSGNKVSRAFQRAVLEKLASSKNSPCFKFVVCEPEDIDEVLERYSFIPRELIYIMPEGVTKEESTATYAKITSKLLETGLNTTPRLQNVMFDGARRGV